MIGGGTIVKKWHGNLKVVLCLFMVLSIICFAKQPIYADRIQDIRKNTPIDKTWVITFNSNVNYDFVNEQYICIKTAGGRTIDAKFKVDPTNPKKINVTPQSGKYLLGETYTLTIKQGFSDENGRKLKQDRVMQFTTKSTLVDTADFKVQVNNSYGMGAVIVSINSISDSLDISKYKVEGQDDDNFVDVNSGKAYIMLNKLQNLNVYFYDAKGKQVGSSIINVQQASNSQIVKIAG